jgi:hypothetical protein
MTTATGEISDKVDTAERRVQVLDTPQHKELLRNIGFGVLKKVTFGRGALQGLANQYVVVRFTDHDGDVQLLFDKLVYSDGKKCVRYSREERHPNNVRHLAQLTTTAEHPYLSDASKVTFYQVMMNNLD